MNSNPFQPVKDFYKRHTLEVNGGILIAAALLRRQYARMFRGTVLKQGPHMTGKIVVISEPQFLKECSGFHAASSFAFSGAKVHVLVPDKIQLNEEKAASLRKQTGNSDIHVHKVDLSNLRSIRKFAYGMRSRAETVDVLVNNADMFKPPNVPSEEGYPRRFAVNYLGRAILTKYLLECLDRSSNGQIINVNNTCFSKYSHVVKEAANLRSDMDYHMNHPEQFESRPHLDIYSYQLLNANKKFVVEMARTLKDTNMTVKQVEIEMRRSRLMNLRLSSNLFESLVHFYRHTHLSAGQLIADAAINPKYDKQSGVVINGRDVPETPAFEDSELFFRHTSEVLEIFEEHCPLRPALEVEKVMREQEEKREAA